MRVFGDGCTSSRANALAPDSLRLGFYIFAQWHWHSALLPKFEFAPILLGQRLCANALAPMSESMSVFPCPNTGMQRSMYRWPSQRCLEDALALGMFSLFHLNSSSPPVYTFSSLWSRASLEGLISLRFQFLSSFCMFVGLCVAYIMQICLTKITTYKAQTKPLSAWCICCVVWLSCHDLWLCFVVS